MWTVDEVTGFLHRLLSPATIPVEYPEDHPLAGHPAGMWVRHGIGYAWKDTPRDVPARVPVLSLDVVNHKFDTLSSLKEWTERNTSGVESSAFVSRADGDAAVLVVLDEERPQDGRRSVTFKRHPRWTRWARFSHPADLTRDDLADFLADNEGDLADPLLAQLIGTLRTAKTITVENDVDAGKNSSVHVVYGSKTETTTKIPRTFEAAFPSHTGAWPAGDEPDHAAAFNLRMIPPHGVAEPTFRVTWSNFADYESVALDNLHGRIIDVLGKCAVVYRGTPDVVVYPEE